MKYKDEDIQRLKEKVEIVAGKKIETPRDFDFLARQVEGYVNERLSVSTLKRIWGYIPSGSNPSRFTLDVLSRMVGYAGWDMFVACGNGEESSFRIVRRKLFTNSLNYGAMVRLAWSPDRVVTIRFEGQDLFTVVESQNSKLCVGDTFHCLQFIEHEPLFLSGLFRPGLPSGDYACGLQGGVSWNIVT